MQLERFQNRRDAGRQLAELLQNFKDRRDVVVVAIPRGGVPVGYEVAQSLNLPLEIIIVRKLGVPGHSELAFGAIASGDEIVINHEIVKSLEISEQTIAKVLESARDEMNRRERVYRDDLPLLELKNKIVILVDDGLATGATIMAAYRAIEHLSPARIILAIPVAASSALAEIEAMIGGGNYVCAITVQSLYSVGYWYNDFRQTTDSEVCDLIRTSKLRIKQHNDQC